MCQLIVNVQVFTKTVTMFKRFPFINIHEGSSSHLVDNKTLKFKVLLVSVFLQAFNRPVRGRLIATDKNGAIQP